MRGARSIRILIAWQLAFLCGPLLVRAAYQGPPLAKLDVVARAAVLTAAKNAGAARPFGARARTDGRLGVFIVGDVDVARLRASGAEVVTELPGMCTALLALDAVPEVAALPGVRQICGARPMGQALDVSIPASGIAGLRGPGPDFSGTNGEGVLVGVVDGGLDLEHPDFLNPDGTTRVVGLWDQTNATGPPPAGFIYGTEWTSADIDGGIAVETPDVHGTEVAGIAVGDGSATGFGVPAYTYAGVAPRAAIAAVKVPIGELTDMDVVNGVAYVFGLAAARGVPAAVNVSLYFQFGPHDGTSPLEAGITALTGPGRIVCVAAGNFGGVPWHAEANAADGDSVTVLANLSSVNQEFWTDGYYDDAEISRVSLRTPDGTLIGPLAFGEENASFPGDTTTMGVVYLWHGDYAGSNEIYFQVREITGTSLLGTWTLSFEPDSNAADGHVDLWHANTGYPAINSGFVVGAQPNEKTVTEPGNAFDVITVGAWSTKPQYVQCNGDIGGVGGTFGDIYGFSSSGPTRDGRLKPDIAAPGLGVGAALADLGFSCPAAGTATRFLPDSLQHSIGTGTSMAAPHVAGVCALILQHNGLADASFVKDYLAASAVSDGFTGAVPNYTWGYGKLNASGLITAIPDPVGDGGGGLRLLPSRPNPAMSATIVAYELDRTADVEIDIFNVAGRRVYHARERAQAPGRHEHRWEGRDDGSSPPAGTYFVRIEGAGVARTGKLVRLR